MKNKFRSLGLLVVIAALALAGAGCTAKVKKAYHESRADKFYAAGQFERAEIEYLNVLRSDAENAKAFTRLGSIYFDQGRYMLSLPFLTRASLLATNDADVKFKLGQVSVAGGDFKTAREIASQLLDRNAQMDQAPLLLVQAARTPADVEAARARLQKLAAAGDRPAYQVALATLALRENDLKSAEASFRRALATAPQNAEALSGLGTVQAAQNDLKSAEASFKAAAEASPMRSTKRMIYARFKLQLGDRAGAKQVLDAVIKEAPDYLPALLGRTEMLLAENNFTEARTVLARILALDAENYDAQLLDARLKFSQGDLPGTVLTMDRMAKIFPQSPRVHYQLAAAYFASGDDNKAQVSANRALELDSNLAEAVVLLAQIQIKNQNPDSAIASLSRIVQRQPEFSEAQLLLADAYRQRGRASEALAIYLGLEKKFANNERLPLLAGATLQQMGQLEKAREKFSQALVLSPTNLTTLESLVNLDIAEKKFDTALQRIATTATPVDKTIALMLAAKVQVTAGNRAAAEQSLLQAVASNNQAENPRLMLGQLYFEDGKKDQAKAMLVEAAKLNPRNVAAMTLLGTIQESTQDFRAAAENYEAILKVNPKWVPALNNLAYIYSHQLPNSDRALELAQAARAESPFDPALGDTLGWIFVQRGSYAAALSLLQASAAKLPNEPEVQYHFGMAAYYTGDEASARTAFQTALSAGKDFSGKAEAQQVLALIAIDPRTADAAQTELLAQRVASRPEDFVALARLAAIYQRTGKTEQAIAAFEKVLKADAKNLSALNSLAVLLEEKDSAKAFAYAKAAYKLAASDPVTLHIYGRLAFENGEYRSAATILQLAAQGLPESGRLQFDIGRALYSMGKISAAQAALAKAQVLPLDAARAADTKRILEFITLANDPAAATAATARIAEVLKAEPDYVPALMAMMTVKNAAGDSAAITALAEKALAKYPEFSPAERALAILYSNDPTKAKQAYALAVKAREDFPSDPPLAKALALTVFHQGEFSRAASLLRECAAKSPADAELFYYLGAAQMSLKDRVGAKANLQQALTLGLSGPLAEAARQLLKDPK